MTAQGGAAAEAGKPGAGTEPALDLRVTAGNPTDDELAAVTAVLHAAVREHAAAAEPLKAAESREWQQASGLLRGQVVPGRRAWRAF